ncbi:hypothetical protein Taro_052597, partial [Colocasia esculenta]|nr:hypothetical protein [Colocasia esculenta]
IETGDPQGGRARWRFRRQLENSSEIAIRRVAELTGDFGKNHVFHKASACPTLLAVEERDDTVTCPLYLVSRLVLQKYND